jgi:hypothetical protein
MFFHGQQQKITVNFIKILPKFIVICNCLCTSENIGENLRTSNSEMFENNLEEAKK